MLKGCPNIRSILYKNFEINDSVISDSRMSAFWTQIRNSFKAYMRVTTVDSSFCISNANNSIWNIYSGRNETIYSVGQYFEVKLIKLF